MAFTESKAYNAGAPWLYRALVFIFTDIEDSFFEKKIMYTQYLVAYAGHITSVNLQYSLKDGSLECVTMQNAQHVWLCMRFALECLLDFVKFLCNDGDTLSRKFMN